MPRRTKKSTKAKARKRSQGFSAKNKNSHAHKTHKQRQKQHTAHNKKIDGKRSKHDEKQRQLQEKRNKSKRRHEKKMAAIQENDDLQASEKSALRNREHQNREQELRAEHQEEMQLRRESRELDLLDERQLLLIEDEYRRRKLPYQYAQARGMYYAPMMGYAQTSIPLPSGPTSASIPNPYHRSMTYNGGDDDNEEDEESVTQGDDDDETPALPELPSPPSMRPLPNPADITALSNMDPLAARRFLSLREAVYIARTVPDIQEASTRFALYTESLDRVFHTHMNIYVQVLKYRPKSWSLEKAGSFVDNLSEDDLNHLLEVKKNDLHDYLLTLK